MSKYGQSGVNFLDVDGKDDYIWNLYSNDDTNDFEGDLDKYDVISQNRTGTTENTSTNSNPTKQISFILPEGIKGLLSINGGDTIKLSIYGGDSDNSDYIQGYRLFLRGLPQKMPGFFYVIQTGSILLTRTSIIRFYPRHYTAISTRG